MASSTKTGRQKTSSAKTSGGKLVSTKRKTEILGLVLMVLSALLTLAIVTYSPLDNELARTFSIERAIEGNRFPQNALGMTGAFLARILVQDFLGYIVVLYSLLLVVWGYVVFRGRPVNHLPFVSVLIVIGSFLLASLTGWLSVEINPRFLLYSGDVGRHLADWLIRIFGTTGSFVLILLLFSILFLVSVEHDVQRWIDRLEESFLYVRDKFKAWRVRRNAYLAEKREARLSAAREDTRKESQDRKTKTLSVVANERKDLQEPVFSRKEEPVQRRDPFVSTLHPVAQPVSSTSEKSARQGTLFPREETSPQLEIKVREGVLEEKAEQFERFDAVDHNDFPYTFPPIDLLEQQDHSGKRVDYDELEENKQVLLDKLATYNIEITGINAVIGPTVTLYELTPAPGIKISRITALEDDLAMAMAARGIRMIAPIPGKSAIGVEIPNRHRELVRIREIIGTAKFQDSRMELPVTIGKTIEGEVFLEDLTKMPHLLIAGATGSGKSVGLNTLIAGLLYSCHPSNLKFVMIDPKKIELQQYARIVDHYIATTPDVDDPIITDFTQALGVLKSCEKEMERRYDLLSKATVRGIKDYNKKFKQGSLPPEEGHRQLPYIIVVVDELADLMMTAGKDIEGPIARLAQMARAVGIHLVLATQRPSVDVITGLIKANFPSRIAYQVASKVDSRTILDQNGAEGLVGNGDLLYMNGSRIIRLQGPFVSVEEVDELTQFIGDQPGPGPYMLPSADAEMTVTDRASEVMDDIDELFNEAARIIVRSQQGSVSILQRKLSIGYTRAARIVDQLEQAGIVGPFEGSKARAVLVQSDMELDSILNAGKAEPF